MNGHIDFPLTLNMLPYTVKKDNPPVDMSEYMYDLSTVVVHQGTMDTGHYTAYTRIGGDQVCFILSRCFRLVLLTTFASGCSWMITKP
jgi:ubiquitin C-terminal hydrolase